MGKGVYRKIDLVAGWVLFAVASMVYLLTMEASASFWDCGEFIACGDKLMVGHPPGAPFFMMLMRMFTMFAPSPELIGIMANAMSALASGATIMFLYWSIAYFARKLVLLDASTAEAASEPNLWQTVLIVGASAVGALCYTFTDTFWFSAVEGEVYALSSLFTAAVFWAILKWDGQAHDPHSGRWIVLIAYLMGLSIGVHLLNLLAIPAIVLVYYFRNYNYTFWGLVKALLLSAALLLVVLYGVIQGLVVLAAYSDLFFVNTLHAPFWLGAFVFGFLLVAAIVVGIVITHKRRHSMANLLLNCFAMLLLGYSSYAMIVIRSAAAPTLDQNGVDDLFAMQAYLNREQYGDRPLVTGPYYNAQPTSIEEGAWVYARRGERYAKVRRKFSLEYDDRMTTIFPRMWSSEPAHVQGYKSWVNIKGRPVRFTTPNGEQKVEYVPTFGENLVFFFRYQLGYMYWRYFMWNFSGRQNDYQGYGVDACRGNWITGIPVLDDIRLGDQSLLPSHYRDNKGRNAYYMLPLLLGLLGLLYHFRRRPKEAGVVLCLFVLTGIAIVVYLNQKPYEPRERDYSYAGSFYAYAIWVGLGVIALAKEVLVPLLKRKIGISSAIALSLLGVPVLMACENWDDHDRSNRYIAVDFAKNMLGSCEQNGILFTYADNDTFPLWYALEAEGYRNDLRICNLTYLSGDWYIDVMARKAYKSDPLPFGMKRSQYCEGVNDRVLVAKALGRPVSLSQGMEFVLSDDSRTKIKSQYVGEPDVAYFPSDSLYQVLPAGVREAYPAQFRNLIKDTVYFVPRGKSMYRNGLAVYGILNNNLWQRKLYYSPMLPNEMKWGLDNFFARKGMVNSIVPYSHPADLSVVDTANSYDLLMNKYSFRGIADPSIYVDETCKRNIQFYLQAFAQTSRALLSSGDTVKARAVAERCLEVLPPKQVDWDYDWLDIIRVLYGSKSALAQNSLLGYSRECVQMLRFIYRAREDVQRRAARDGQVAFSVLSYLRNMAVEYGDQEAVDEIDSYGVLDQKQ